jgi:hypothetical protein
MDQTSVSVSPGRQEQDDWHTVGCSRTRRGRGRGNQRHPFRGALSRRAAVAQSSSLLCFACSDLDSVLCYQIDPSVKIQRWTAAVPRRSSGGDRAWPRTRACCYCRFSPLGKAKPVIRLVLGPAESSVVVGRKATAMNLRVIPFRASHAGPSLSLSRDVFTATIIMGAWARLTRTGGRATKAKAS